MADTGPRMPTNDLSNLDIDEASPVRRGAIGKLWAFLKSNDEGDLELAKATVDAMGEPVAGEEAYVAKLREGGMDDVAIEAAVVSARLSKAFNLAKAKPDFTAIDAQQNVADLGSDNDTDSTDDNDADDDWLGQAAIAKDSDAYTATLDAKKRKNKISGDPNPADDVDAAFKHGAKKNTPLVKSGVADAGTGNNDKERGMGDSPSVPVQKADGTWDLSGVDADARPFYDAFLKSHDDAVAKADALAARVEKAEADSADLRDKLVVKEITAAAEGDFSKIAKADELVPVLKAAKDTLPAEQYDALATILKAANARIEAGDLFAELGRSADPIIKDAIARGENFTSGGGDVWDQIVEKANALVLKDGDDLTEEQRVDRFLKTAEGKRLYADYQADNQAVTA